jgi:hypothetical protein
VWFDDLFHELGPCRQEEQRFSARIHPGILQVCQNAANLVADRSTAWLTSDQDWVTLLD